MIHIIKISRKQHQTEYTQQLLMKFYIDMDQFRRSKITIRQVFDSSYLVLSVILNTTAKLDHK